VPVFVSCLLAATRSEHFCHELRQRVVDFLRDSPDFLNGLPIDFSACLWPPYGIGRPLYFCPVVSFFFLLFSSHNFSGRRLDVYHTSSHGVALVMVALCNRADHNIFVLLLSSSSFFFSSPNLSGRRLDVYHTLAHGVALVRI